MCSARDVGEREQRLLGSAEVLVSEVDAETARSDRIEHLLVTTIGVRAAGLEDQVMHAAGVEFVDQPLEAPAPAPLGPGWCALVPDDEDLDRVAQQVEP